MKNLPRHPWKSEKICDFATIGTGDKDTQDRSFSGRYPFFVRSQRVEKIDSWSFDGEAVLTAGDGVGTGKVFHYIDGKFDYHQRVYKISDFREDVSGKYFYYQFKRNFLERIEPLTAKSSVDSVRMESIAGMRIALPSVEEQERIVRALDDAVNVVGTLERLIAKKQAVKQGMMQQLLTGRTRLPGFEEEWTVFSIGEIAKLRSGRPKRQSSSGPNWIVDMGSVTRDGELAVSKKTWSHEGFLKAGELVMPKDDIGGGHIIGRSALIEQSNAYILADHVYAITPFRVDAAFLHFAINSYEVNTSLRSKATGSAQLGLSIGSVVDQPIFHPSSRAEQQAIAEILIGVDHEIDVLRERLEKARAVKVGMMQQLLTGRVRLPVVENV